jgi:hypothetical protein
VFDKFAIPSNFLDWYSLNALVNTPNNTNVKFDIYDNNNNLLKEDVGNGATFTNFVEPIIQPRITLSRNTTADPSPSFDWLEIGMRGAATGMWQKIDEITLDTDTSQLDISIPKENKEIRIVGTDLQSTYHDSQPMYLRFNNDDTSNHYYWTRASGTSVSTNSGTGNIELYHILGYSDYYGGVEINIIDSINSVMVTADGANTRGDRSSHIVGGWRKNSALETINLEPARPLKKGCKFEIWGR